MNNYNSVILEFRSENTSGITSTLDGSVNMSSSITIPPNRRCVIKPISCLLSTRIPNIFKYAPTRWDNTKIRVKRNIADGWTTIVLSDGIYLSINEMQAALMSVIGSWMTNIAQPALLFSMNTVTDQIYITIDSNLLAAGGTQMCLDLSQSKIAYTLGFPDLTTKTADGLYASTQVVRFDTQGTICDVVCDLTNMRYLNGIPKRILFSIPLQLMSSSLTEYLYPIYGQEPPEIQFSNIGTQIMNYKIEFKTYENVPMVFLKGSRCEVIFEIRIEV